MRFLMLAAGVACAATATTMYLTSAMAADHAISALSSPDQFEDADGDNDTTITAGDTVTWSWSGGNQHNVKAEGDAFVGSGPFTEADTHTVQFDTPGTFPYYCEVHGGPGGFGMHGTIIVQAGTANTPQPTNTSVPGATNTATRTSTPQATSSGTVTAVPTSAPGEATPIVAVPISATEPPPASGGTRAAVTAPSVGTGDAASSTEHGVGVLTLALAAVGAMLIGGAALARRRA